MLSDLKYITFVVARDAESNVYIVQYNNPYPKELTKVLEQKWWMLLNDISINLHTPENAPVKKTIDDLLVTLYQQDVCNFITLLFEFWFRYGTKNYENLYSQFDRNADMIANIPEIIDIPAENMWVYYEAGKIASYKDFEKLMIRIGIQAALTANYGGLKFAKN